jgi:hypothetical protein
MKRAEKSGISLSVSDVSTIKAMLLRGDRQHDVAAWFGVNPGRIAEIATNQSYGYVTPAEGELPPKGPYLSAREAEAARRSLKVALAAMADADVFLSRIART